MVKLYCFTLRLNLQTDLYKEWNGVESSDDYSVVDISGQDVKCSCTPFHNLLHTYSLLINKQRKISALAASLSTDFLVDRVVLRTTALSVNSRHHGLVFIKAVWIHWNDESMCALTTNCCCVPPMLVRLCVSWCALTSSWTSLGMAPCSLKGAWFAGQRARLRIRPTVAWQKNTVMCHLATILMSLSGYALATHNPEPYRKLVSWCIFVDRFTEKHYFNLISHLKVNY